MTATAEIDKLQIMKASNETVKSKYASAEGAADYVRFLASVDGQQFQTCLGEQFERCVEQSGAKNLLDLACGSGWLAQRLQRPDRKITGADGSAELLKIARSQANTIEWQEVDCNQTLPWSDEKFDGVIWSMAAHDIEQPQLALQEIARILKPGGHLFMTVVNPHYAFPVGVWKRGWLGWLLRRAPQLRVRPYFQYTDQTYGFRQKLHSNFYKLADYFNWAVTAGLQLKQCAELQTPSSKQDDFNRRLSQFPLIWYVEWTKPEPQLTKS